MDAVFEERNQFVRTIIIIIPSALTVILAGMLLVKVEAIHIIWMIFFHVCIAAVLFIQMLESFFKVDMFFCYRAMFACLFVFQIAVIAWISLM